MNVLLQGRIAADHHEFFSQHMDEDWTCNVWDPKHHDVSEFAPMAAQANVIVGGNIPLDTWPAVNALQLFQIPWTGFNFTAPDRMPAGIPVANCFEHESAIAEYVLLVILEWQLRLRAMDDRFRKEGWGGRFPAGGIFHQEVRGQTLGIIGYGHIGESVATRAAAFDMNLMATRRREQPTPAPLNWLGTQQQLPELLANSDFILLACDLNDDTRNLINKDTLAMMKPNAVVINVARGEVINEQDLYDALVAKQIGGAVLDVWYNYNQIGQPEVWPCNLPFQDLDNVILSAHESGWTREQDERRWLAVIENIKRVAKDESAQNIVFTGTAKSA